MVGVEASVRQQDLGEVLPDGAMLVHEAAGLATEPDLMFCSWEGLRSGRVRYAARGRAGDLVEVVGAPDLVVEVVSRHSVAKDTRRLRKLYHQAGIPEYWLIDVRCRAVAFRLLVHGRRGYAEAKPDADGYARSPVLGRGLRLARGRNPVGGWRYDLLLR
jgi:Uma2 family endonuclease